MKEYELFATLVIALNLYNSRVGILIPIAQRRKLRLRNFHGEMWEIAWKAITISGLIISDSKLSPKILKM